MKYQNISELRLHNQSVGVKKYSGVKELAAAMGAVQAQDPNMVKWALGIRLPGSSINNVDNALSSGEIIRTHLLRPTWHIVASEDASWMIRLSSPRIRRSTSSRHRELGLTPELLKKSRNIIEKALLKAGHLTREELVKILENARINTKENRASHIFMDAELECLICSGPPEGKKHTYALFEERITHNKKLNKDEAIAELAYRYFYTRGPAAVGDFAWWSGLNLTEAKRAVASLDDSFVEEKVGESTYILHKSSLSVKPEKGVFLLPAYDELIICYKDREPTVRAKLHKQAVSSNGLFRPVVIVDGKAEGIWKHVRGKDKIIIEIKMFETSGKKWKKLIESASREYGKFLNSDVEIVYSD